VFVGLTTLPSRIGKLEPTIRSLLAQTLPPDRIFVCLPLTSIRERCGYSLPPWLSWLPPRVQLVRCTQDYGPGTKLLGCLPQVPTDACLIVVDDDMVYKPFLVERLYRAQVDRRDTSFSFFVERIGRLRCGQGADGFSFWTPNLAGIEAFAAVALESRHLFVADDLWISMFLQNTGVRIASLQHTLAANELVWERSHADGQLSDAIGDLGRRNVFREGTRYLVSTGLVGTRLRLLVWATMIERGTARLARGVASALLHLPDRLHGRDVGLGAGLPATSDERVRGDE
jgi:hypothetical protein